MMEYARKDTHFLAYLVRALLERMAQIHPEEELDALAAQVFRECQALCLRVFKKPAVFTEKYFKRLQILETNGSPVQVQAFSELWVVLPASKEHLGSGTGRVGGRPHDQRRAHGRRR